MRTHGLGGPQARGRRLVMAAVALAAVSTSFAVGCGSTSTYQGSEAVPPASEQGGMVPYANRGGDSNVAAYEAAADFIRVEFKDGSVYLYTYASAGEANIERMKELARAGEGLNSFINKNVKYSYESKQR